MAKNKLTWTEQLVVNYAIRYISRRRKHYMCNWRTSLFGLISAIGLVLPYFGVPQDVATAVQTVGVFLFGFFAKDHTVTGVGR